MRYPVDGPGDTAINTNGVFVTPTVETQINEPEADFNNPFVGPIETDPSTGYTYAYAQPEPVVEVSDPEGSFNNPFVGYPVVEPMDTLPNTVTPTSGTTVAEPTEQPNYQYLYTGYPDDGYAGYSDEPDQSWVEKFLGDPGDDLIGALLDPLLPGDQDTIGDFIPDFLEKDEGDTFWGALLDPLVPGDQDSVDDFYPENLGEITETLTDNNGLVTMLMLGMVMSSFGDRD